MNMDSYIKRKRKQELIGYHPNKGVYCHEIHTYKEFTIKAN